MHSLVSPCLCFLEEELTNGLAAWEAFKRCERLHRDISINNIILVRRNNAWRIGFLVDWELSCKANSNAAPRGYNRSVGVEFKQSYGYLLTTCKGRVGIHVNQQLGRD